MRAKLTPKAVEHLPPTDGKRYEVRDTLVVGLLVRVSRTGGKVWYVTTRANGRVRRIKIGTYPIISLADAREKAREVLRQAQLGRLPNEDDGPGVPVLSEVVPQFISVYAKPRNRGWRGTERLLAKFDRLNKTPINEITRSDIAQILDEMVIQGIPFRANRALAAIKKLFGWCVERGLLETNPLSSLKPPTKERPRDRVLSKSELLACWHSALAQGFPFEQFLKLLILTGQRRGEVAGMRWSEIDFEEATWTIPAERTKNGTLHVVPLVPQTIALLKHSPRFASSDLVFTTTGQTPISGFSRLKRRLKDHVGPTDWRLHDIRRTMATNMAMAGVQPHVIEAVLNHKSGLVSGVAAVYNRHTYLKEKRAALTIWAEILDVIINEKVVYKIDSNNGPAPPCSRENPHASQNS